MRLADRFNTIACLAVGAAILCYCAAEPAPGLALIAAPLLFAGWRVGRRATPWTLPRAVSTTLALLAIAWTGLKAFQPQAALVSSLAEFLILLALLKLFDRRSPRDESQLVSLSLFIVIGAILTANSLPVGVLLLVYSPLVAAAAMLLQIRTVEARAAAAQAAAVAADPVTAVRPVAPGNAARNRGSGGRHLAEVTLAAVVLASGLAVVGFLVTPRGFAQGTLGPLGMLSRSTVGFTDQVRLGKAGLLSEDTTPVMDVLLTDLEDQSIGDAARPLYLRGSVLDRYSTATGSWSAGDRGQIELPTRTGGSSGTRLRDDDPTAKLQVTTRSGSPAYLFSTWAPVRVQPPKGLFVLAPGADLTLQARPPDRAEGGPGALSRVSPTGRFSYTVWTSPDIRAEGRRRAPPMEIPERVRELAERTLTSKGISTDADQRGPGDNRAAAGAIQSYLRSTYAYTTQMEAPQAGKDPIEMFLFQTKRGHCEYFASAMVAMCRAVGLHARLVTGFLAAEFNSVTGQYLVRQSNAHAWVEVGLGDGRWLTLDPSPPADIARLHHGSGGGLLGRLKQFYDAIDFAWNSSIVSFDERRRSDLLGPFLQRVLSTRRWMDSIKDAGKSIGVDGALSTIRYLAPALRWLIGIATVLVLAILLRRPLLRLLRRRSRRARPEDLDPALAPLMAEAGFYREVLASLRSAGLAKPEHRPPLAHASTLTEADPDLGRLVDDAGRLFYQLRFARSPLTREQTQRARELPARVAARIGADRKHQRGPQSPPPPPITP